MSTINQISEDDKSEIRDALKNYVDLAGSMNVASKQLQRISIATISNVLSGKDEHISGDMWRKIKSQVVVTKDQWVIVEDTLPFVHLKTLVNDARNYQLTLGITAFAGTGKTEIGKYFASDPNFYFIRCSNYFNSRTFLRKLLASMGKDNAGYSSSEMMEEVLEMLHKAERPPVIFLDEADKLTDAVLYFFITLYNELEGKCGFVLIATDNLSKRIKRGVANGKKGYAEIYSRIGRNFLEIQPADKDDQRRIIRANGVSDDITVETIINKSQGDLRRIKMLVFAEKRKEETRA
ncbi:MAG: ATP-binding protein [Cyclobacteriaceae bacterium]